MKKGKSLIKLAVVALALAGCGKIIKDRIDSAKKDDSIETSWTEIDIESADDGTEDEEDSELS